MYFPQLLKNGERPCILKFMSTTRHRQVQYVNMRMHRQNRSGMLLKYTAMFNSLAWYLQNIRLRHRWLVSARANDHINPAIAFLQVTLLENIWISGQTLSGHRKQTKWTKA